MIAARRYCRCHGLGVSRLPASYISGKSSSFAWWKWGLVAAGAGALVFALRVHSSRSAAPSAPPAPAPEAAKKGEAQ